MTEYQQFTEGIVAQALSDIRRRGALAVNGEYEPMPHYTADSINARIETVCRDAVEAARWSRMRLAYRLETSSPVVIVEDQDGLPLIWFER